ncbi:MAG: hypothetical protein ACREBS_02965, partial [Nitrososphaerales archaeon]
PRILNKQMSNARFIFRIILGFFLALMIILLFYYLPTHLTALASPVVPHEYLPELQGYVSYLTGTSIPYLGLLIAIMFFLDTIFAGTWGYGVILAVSGLLYVSYDLTLFERRSLFVNSFPQMYVQVLGYSMVTEILEALVIISILLTIFSIGRGIHIIMTKR